MNFTAFHEQELHWIGFETLKPQGRLSRANYMRKFRKDLHHGSQSSQLRLGRFDFDLRFGWFVLHQFLILNWSPVIGPRHDLTSLDRRPAIRYCTESWSGTLGPEVLRRVLTYCAEFWSIFISSNFRACSKYLLSWCFTRTWIELFLFCRELATQLTC